MSIHDEQTNTHTVHHLPYMLHLFYSKSQAYRELNIVRVLDENTRVFFFFSPGPDSCFWEFHTSSVTLGIFFLIYCESLAPLSISPCSVKSLGNTQRTVPAPSSSLTTSPYSPSLCSTFGGPLSSKSLTTVRTSLPTTGASSTKRMW